MSDQQFIKVSIERRVATVAMIRGPLNILHNPMMEELNAALEKLVADQSLIAIVLRASGKAFSAGVDVGDHSPQSAAEMIRLFHGIFRKLASTDAIIIAAVQGAALGGGCELACFCDIVLASSRAKFGQPEVKVGVFPPIAAIILSAQVGIKKAVELNVLGGTIDAQEAYRIGLINAVFDQESFDADVDTYIEEVRTLSGPVARLAKRATLLGERERFLERLDEVEELYLGELMELSDAHEGVSAFLERREPVWSHA